MTTPQRRRRAPRTEGGSLLVEALLTVVPVGLAIVLNVDLARHAWKEVLVHHGTFLAARELAVGGEAKSRHFFGMAAEVLGGKLQVESGQSAFGATTKAHLKFQTLVRFPFATNEKHAFEVTHQCTFPYSR